MAELKVELPGLLKGETKKLEQEIAGLVAEEEKRKRLALFLDEVMRGARQVDEAELIRLGRTVKRDRGLRGSA